MAGPHVGFCYARFRFPAGAVAGALPQRRPHTDVETVSGVRGLYSEVVLGGTARQGWWHVADGEDGPGRIVAGPFRDRTDADWAVGTHRSGGVEPVYGMRRADGGLDHRESPQTRSWLVDLQEQLDRLPEDWDADLPDDDPLVTLVVEVVAALTEAGLPLREQTGETGGVCLTPQHGLDGIVVAWRQHDRMSVEQVHGPDADVVAQQVMNHALADLLAGRGFTVEAFGGGSGHVIRLAA